MTRLNNSRRLAAFFAVLSLAVGLTAIAPTPAQADHTNAYGHWYRGWDGGYPSPPIVDRNWTTYSNGRAIASDVALYWKNVSGAVVRPYLAELGTSYPQDCSHRDWTIVICVAAFSNTRTPEYVDTSVSTYDGTHIRSAVIRINSRVTGGWNDIKLQRAVSHGVGHALGLGNTTCCSGNTVMKFIPDVTSSAAQHDVDALRGAMAHYGY